MIRRPLYGAALVLLLACLALPPSLWMRRDIRAGTATFTGTVGRREQRENMQVFYLKNTSIPGARWILVYLKDSNSQYFIGNTLEIKGNIKTYETPGNPGQFNSLAYYQTKKIDAMCFANRVRIVDGRKNAFLEGLYSLRECFSESLKRTLGERDAGVLTAMLLGERWELPQDIKTLYQRSGIAHLLAISGLHISVLGAGLYRGLRRTGLPYVAAGLPALAFMGCYGILVGAGVSTLRALTMFCLAVGADLLGRTYDMPTALGISALWLLVSQPLYARDSAFLLSFGAVLGLAEAAPVLKALAWGEGEKAGGRVRDGGRKAGGKIWKAGKWLRDGLTACLAIQIVTLPVLLRSFYEIPVYAPFLNLLVLPLMGLLLGAGLFSGILGLFLPAAALPFVWACRFILRFVELAAGISGGMPGAVYCGGCPEGWQIAVYYGGLGVILLVWKMRENKKRTGKIKRGGKNCLIYGGIYMGCILTILWRDHPGLRITMLDVGQGDAIFFQAEGGNTYLVDGGSSSEKNIGRYVLEPFFKYNGEPEVDYLLASHLDADHISGVREILEEGLLEVGCLILPGTAEIRQAIGQEEGDNAASGLAALAEECKVPVRFMKAGDTLQEGALTLCCLGPEGGVSYENRNAGSLVLSLKYKEFHVLFTGDLEGSGERRVLERGFPEKAYDILKVAHHGSRYTTGEEWLSRVRPRVSLISCGKENAYGHPHEELLERIGKTGSRIYLTPRDGAVCVESDGEKYRVRAWRE